MRTYSGGSSAPSRIVFDGRDESGALLPDGSYSARVTSKYINGYECEPGVSPSVVLDTEPPRTGKISCGKIFNPDEDTSFLISQSPSSAEGSPVERWGARIVSGETGKAVAEYDFGPNLPERVQWNGLTADRQIAPDGVYSYIVFGTDMAGNAGEIRGPDFRLDTTETELMLSVEPEAFNSGKGNVVLIPVVRSGKDVVEHEISIMDRSTGVEVWSQKGKRLPQSFSWNGRSSKGNALSDGEFVALLETKSSNMAEASAKSPVFRIDNTAPSASAKPNITLFSPDGDGRKDSVRFSVKSSSESAWTGKIADASGKAVKTFAFSGSVPDFEWDGTDDSGNTVPDGTYKLVLSSTDTAGNFGSSEVSGIRIDTAETKAFVTVEHDAFSPNGDGFLESETFKIHPSVPTGIEDWKFQIVSPEGAVVRTFERASMGNLPPEIEWDGTDGSGSVAEGVFVGKLSISYEKGNLAEATTQAFVCCVTPPELSVKTSPDYFSPDNDGENDELYMKLKADCHSVAPKSWSLTIFDPTGKAFWQTSGKSAITEQIVWDGRSNVGTKGELVESAMDYPYEFTVTDSLGLSSKVEGVVNVDILVLRTGDVLKLRVPSIIFRRDASDFGVNGEKDAGGNVIKNGITEEQKKNNERVLKRIAQILNKFKQYTVTVEGHANNMSGTDIEERENTSQYGLALIPLSEKRAEFVKNYLIKCGVDRARLSSVGRGGTEPIVDRADKENWWKNRRVEFILNK